MPKNFRLVLNLEQLDALDDILDMIADLQKERVITRLHLRGIDMGKVKEITEMVHQRQQLVLRMSDQPWVEQTRSAEYEDKPQYDPQMRYTENEG